MLIFFMFRVRFKNHHNRRSLEKYCEVLPRKYEVVFSIEVSNDLNVLTIDELFGSLQSHEDQYTSYDEAHVVKAFLTKLNMSKKNDAPSNRSSNRRGLSFQGRRGR